MLAIFLDLNFEGLYITSQKENGKGMYGEKSVIFFFEKSFKLLFCNLNLLLFLPLSLPSPSLLLELPNHKTKRSTFSQSENASVSLLGLITDRNQYRIHTLR